MRSCMWQMFSNDQRYNIIMLSAFLFTFLVFIVAMWTGTNINDKIRYSVHYSAYEICYSNLANSERPHDISQCSKLDNTRPKE